MPGSAELTCVNDLDDLNQQVGWQAEYRQLRPGHFHAQFCFGSSSVFDLTKETLTGALEVLGVDQDDAVSLLIRRPSSGQLRFNGRAMDEGDSFLLMPGGELQAHTQSCIIVDTLRIPLSRIAAVANALDLPWRGVLTGASRKLKVPRSVVSGLARAMDDALLSGAADSEAALDQAVERFVASLLSPAEVKPASSQRSRSGSFRNFRIALEFIDSNLSERIPVSEICRQAEVGIKTLERQFVRETGVLPLAYIKARRLNAARRSLIAAAPQETRITRIAAEHGITHLGRFAREYQHFFGELPSKTLQRLS